MPRNKMTLVPLSRTQHPSIARTTLDCKIDCRLQILYIKTIHTDPSIQGSMRGTPTGSEKSLIVLSVDNATPAAKVTPATK